MRVDFSVTHLRHTPAQFNHLSGLLDVFKSKLVGLNITILYTIIMQSYWGKIFFSLFFFNSKCIQIYNHGSRELTVKILTRCK